MSVVEVDEDKLVEFTKGLYKKTVYKHYVILNKPRNAKGEIRAYNVVRLFSHFKDKYPSMHSEIVNIESWPQSYCVYLNEEKDVGSWAAVRSIHIDESVCHIFVPNRHDGVVIKFVQIPSFWDENVLREFVSQFGTPVSVVKNKLSDGHEDTTGEVIFDKAPLI